MIPSARFTVQPVAINIFYDHYFNAIFVLLGDIWKSAYGRTDAYGRPYGKNVVHIIMNTTGQDCLWVGRLDQ